MSQIQDRKDLMERLGGDAELAKELIEDFRIEAPELLERVRDAVRAGNADALSQSAHALKGSAGAVSATAVAGVANELESMAGDGRLSDSLLELGRLDTEMARLLEALEADFR